MARPAQDPDKPARRRPAALRAALWAGGALVALVVLVLFGLLVLNTAPGRGALAGLLGRTTLPAGLHLQVGRIDGSIWGRMILRDVALSDSKGVFLRSPEVVLDWTPSALAHREISIQEASADTVRVLRRPALEPAPPRPNQSTVPNIQATLDRLSIANLWLEPPVAGERRRLRVAASGSFVRGRTRADLDVAAEPVAGSAAGDRLVLKLDAQPSANRLLLDARLAAPKGGVVDRLAGLDQPLTAQVQGSGTWARWDGTAVADLGGSPLLRSTLSARSGRFAAKGSAYPALLLQGPAADLTRPKVDFGVTGFMTDRQLDVAADLRSPALQVAAAGRLDLARSRFVGLKIRTLIPRPAVVSDILGGRDLQLQATLDGAFARPAAVYNLTAPVIVVQGKTIEQLAASGKATPEGDEGWAAQFQASLRSLSGAGPTAAALASRLRVEGTGKVSQQRIALTRFQATSEHLKASGDLDLQFQSGRIAASIKADARATPIPGLGLVDASANVRVAPGANRTFVASGGLHGRTVRIDNPAAARALGGQATVDASITRAANGAIALTGLRLTAPRFRIVDGRAAYGPGDRIAASARAVSADYGPLTLDVGGTLAAPQATLHADNLGLGGLKAVDLRLNGAGKNAYAVQLRGDSAYGPVSADVGLNLQGGALVANVRSAEFAGIHASGQARRTASGPFAGTLRIAGRGLNGTVDLSAVGAVQAADLALSARSASLPLTPPVTISRGAVRARVVLYPKAPSVTATADLSGVRRETLALDQARLSLQYAGGSGQASLSAAGSQGAPFTLALGARITPQLVSIDGGGSVDRLPIRLASPAVIRKTADGYQLDPAVIVARDSRVQLSGSYGKGLRAHLNIERLDLGLSRVFAPGLGVSGQAVGALDLVAPPGGAAPSGQLRLQIQRFTRSTAAEVSEPVDLTLAADLGATGASANALVRRRGAVVGRVQARVAMAPGAGAWTDRLRRGALSGGVRYNGPAETLWSLSGLAEQSLSGPIAIGADLNGTPERPRLAGIARAQALRYENSKFGTVIDNIQLNAAFVDTRLVVNRLVGRAGSGAVSATGYADLSAANGFPIDLRVRLDGAQLARSDDLAATVSGQLWVVNARGAKPLISGDLRLDQARYQVVRQGKDEIVELTGVHRAGEPLVEIKPSGAQAKPEGPPTGWNLDIHVRAPQQLYVRGMGLDSEWRSDLRITGDLANPIVVGEVNLVRGTFSFAGRELTLSRGVIHLNGSNPPNPTLDIQASSTVDNVTATINIGGSARAPEITFSSTPALPQDEVLSRLLFGTSIGQLSPIQAVQLASSLNALRGGGGGLNPLGKLRQATGFDRLRFYGADKTSGRGPSVGAGRYIGKNLYVELTTDAQGFTATQIELALTRSLHLLSRVGTFGGAQLELRYSKDY